MKRFRETRFGRFVTPQQAADYPDSTVGETVSGTARTIGQLRLRCAALEDVCRQQAENLRLQTGIQNLEWIAGELDKAAGEASENK